MKTSHAQPAPSPATLGSILCAGLGLFLAGCTPGAAPAPAGAAQRLDRDFLAPPVLTGAAREPDGAIRLGGSAEPGAAVDLVSPDGVRLHAVADAQGGWATTAPFASAPRLFALSSTLDGRTLRASGAMVTAPPPAAAAYLARTGAASLATRGPGPLRIVAFDYDPGGGAGVAGVTAASVDVELAIDGVAAGAGRSDGEGRYSILAVRAPLTPGRHLVAVRTPSGVATVAVRMTPATPLGGAAVRVLREAGDWRIDWTPPGGGVQTTLALAQPAGAR